jgi:hypothetical protein
MQDIVRLQAKINAIKEALPENLQISETNIQRFYGTLEWTPYLMLYTWIFQLHLDLYRFSLPGIREQATSDLLRVLPPEFVDMCRYQAISFAITLGRFWESCQGVVNRHSQMDTPVITADSALPSCAIHCTKILLIARQYRMFFDLQTHSTVPPFRNEPVDDTVLAGLIESNLALLDNCARFMPNVGSMVRTLKNNTHICPHQLLMCS